MTEPPAVPSDWEIVEQTLLARGVGGAVWAVTRRERATAIVKVASEGARSEVVPAADYLRWRDGRGAVRLLAMHAEQLLLEHAGQERLLDLHRERGDDAATETAAAVVLELHAPSRTLPPSSLTPLRKHFASLFARAEAERAQGTPGRFTNLAAFAGDLLERQRDVQPLHGDIHHENILRGPRGWLAIDPKGLIGDPAFDVANLFHNPAGSPLCLSPARIASMAAILARTLDRSVSDILSYATAYSWLSASWWLDDGNISVASDTLAIGEAILGVLVRQPVGP
ncbi:MAG: aminoglycoside phosphotransferase family protein [Rhizobiaceae bacterium]